MNWRAYALRFLTTQGLHWYFRSERNPTTTQLGLLALFTPFIAAFVVSVEVVWLLTGRARRIRHALGDDEVQVIPGARGVPPQFRERIDELIARNRDEFERMRAEREERARQRAEREP